MSSFFYPSSDGEGDVRKIRQGVTEAFGCMNTVGLTVTHRWVDWKDVLAVVGLQLQLVA